MPKGTIAPGKVLPPPLVHVRVSTNCAGLLTGALTMAELRAPLGRSDFGVTLGQFTRCPSAPFAQATWVPGVRAAWPPGVGGGLGVDEALGLGLAGLEGAAAATAFPPTSAVAASAATTADIRTRRWESALVMTSSGRPRRPSWARSPDIDVIGA